MQIKPVVVWESCGKIEKTDMPGFIEKNYVYHIEDFLLVNIFAETA